MTNNRLLSWSSILIQDIRLLITTLGIQRERAIALGADGTSLDYKFEVNPEEFLDRAEQDYEAGGSAALLNSITNAKRAIHCQIDKVIYCIGFDAKSMKIVSKINLLKDIGFVAPRIMRRIDNARNLLEHEYKHPTIEEVQDALELVGIFIDASNRSLDACGSSFTMGNKDEYIKGSGWHFLNELEFYFDSYKKKGFGIIGCRKTPSERTLKDFMSDENFEATGWFGDAPDGHSIPGLSREPICTFFVSAGDPMYIPILRLAVNIEKKRVSKVDKAVVKFFDSLEQIVQPNTQPME